MARTDARWRRSLRVRLALSLAHVTQLVRLLYELHVVLQIPDVLAGDANIAPGRRLSRLSWGHFDRIAGLERQFRAVAAEAPPDNFLCLQFDSWKTENIIFPPIFVFEEFLLRLHILCYGDNL